MLCYLIKIPLLFYIATQAQVLVMQVPGASASAAAIGPAHVKAVPLMPLTLLPSMVCTPIVPCPSFFFQLTQSSISFSSTPKLLKYVLLN